MSLLQLLCSGRPIRKAAVSILSYCSRVSILFPHSYVCLGVRDENSTSELIRRTQWYWGSTTEVEVYAKSGGQWRLYRVSSAGVTQDACSRLRMVLAACFGKLCFTQHSPMAQRLDAWFGWKFFLVSWDETFQISAWRFSAARESRPLRRLNQTFTREDSRPRARECVVLGNGPSAHLALRDEYADCDFIICNTAVKSEALLRRKVVALCIADAAYFQAPHDYARALHARMREVVARDKISLYVDAEQEQLWHDRVPNLSPDQVFPVLFNPFIPYQTSFRTGRIQKNGFSVFTMLLLPVATTYYRRIHLIGFDGKSPDVKQYFWKHDDEFQYTSLLPTVKETEPAFFIEKDYEQYNRNNADSIEEALSAVEAQGIEVIMSHPSFIPPLQKRYLKGGTRLKDLDPSRTTT